MSSTGLMSCMRENSPPVEMTANEAEPFSLPNNVTTESQKRRRFHPLRNLRRIFRRRTLSGADALGRTVFSTPSSPLSQASQASFTSSQSTSSPPTVITSVSAHKSPCYFHGEGSTWSPVDVTTMSSVTTGAVFPPSQPHPISLSASREVGGCGLSIVAPIQFKLTASASGRFSVKNVSDNVFSRCREPTSTALANAQDMEKNRDMMDHQRSLSEGRLVDSDFNRDTLSQSRDSVFSESATASSLSLGLKAELFDVIRKRRNRPDASEEDLGLPRSPVTPQRKEHIVNQSEVSSLSLLSMASSELDDEFTSTQNSSGGIGYKTTISGYSSSGGSKYSFSETSRHLDEIDLDIVVGPRLSHSAARHKMAVRPKKKGPSRHRRPMESNVLPSTPEINEDMLRLSTGDIKDSLLENNKTKSHSLPSGVNAKILEQHRLVTVKESPLCSMKRSKTDITSVSSSCVIQSVRSETEDVYNSQTPTLERNDDEGIFFKSFWHRSSKKNKRSIDGVDNVDVTSSLISIESCENDAVKNEEIKPLPNEVTRKELPSELKSGRSALLNSVTPPPILDRHYSEGIFTHKLPKPKSGAASRQRVQPQDLSIQAPPPPPDNTLSKNSPVLLNETEKQMRFLDRDCHMSPASCSSIDKNLFEKPEILAKPLLSEEHKIPIKLKVAKDYLLPTITFTHEHFEKKDSRVQPKIVALSPFQQKIYRVECSTLDSAVLVPKQRKTVEKSKSFRYSNETETPERNLIKRENMPSLPDLTTSRKLTEFNDFAAVNVTSIESKTASSMGFEINDNNLIKARKPEELVTVHSSLITKSIIVSTTKPSSPTSNKDITEIEESIDKLVKSPFITVIGSEEPTETKVVSNVSPTISRKFDHNEPSERAGIAQTTLKFSDRMKSASTEVLSIPEAKSIEKFRVENFEQKLFIAASDSSAFDKKSTLELTEESNAASTPTKSRRSSVFLESKSSSVDENIPEFMKIQLNRVDSTRPKSNLVLSKNVKTSDFEVSGDLNRRFSNESVEITNATPPLPSDIAINASPLITSKPVAPIESVVKSPVIKVDEENNILGNAESILVTTGETVVKEGKHKYLKKMEDQKAEKRKAVIEANRETVEKETGVLLRKKSFPVTNQGPSNKEETPELMKVFARRSLKIKDTDDTQSFDDSDSKNSFMKSSNVESDKENQSSSEEKLDKLPKVEIAIQPKPAVQNGQLAPKNDEKTRTSVTDLFRKPNTAALINTTTPKPFVQPLRYSSVSTYRSLSTAFVETKTSSLINATALNTSIPTFPQLITGSTLSSKSMVIEENEQNNNTTPSVPTTNGTNNSSNIRHTIGTSSPVTAILMTREDTAEFKGILQRRAEWEQRAKEASK